MYVQKYLDKILKWFDGMVTGMISKFIQKEFEESFAEIPESHLQNPYSRMDLKAAVIEFNIEL